MEPFNDQEKRHLLAEIIKHSQLDVIYLENLVRHIEPNWMQMQLPNGRNMAQCMETAQNMYIGQRGTKRKASEEESSIQNNIDGQLPSDQALSLLSQPSPAQNSPANFQRQPAMTPGPHLQQHQQPEQPPKKKKGRPAYAGRDVTSQRPFNPRPIAPKPSAQILQNSHSVFRTIAPAPQAVLPPRPPGSLDNTYRGLSRAPVEFQNTHGNLDTYRPSITPSSGMLQPKQAAGILDNIRHGEQMSNRPRSLSEAVPRVQKQEGSPNNRSSSLQPMGTDDQSRIMQSRASDQMQETKPKSDKETTNRRQRKT
ncbi:hypothetical protein FOQG_03811 [Fusarium oxysporum f. sp. raphani 54005]|uniref:Uncharacterized protein n=2 Tax=Fusarium oxysporum f. sp. raphani TaxID=96318 RepID=X0DL77_FUSOX|nr:hypothetical protein FOQG_03811 [Fusarium oxysporum f. sp. raphani 54005]KAG7432644.1 hypothetical protein Forpi1262_v006559 [Fusarium oxysporum f. sp. raphani]